MDGHPQSLDLSLESSWQRKEQKAKEEHGHFLIVLLPLNEGSVKPCLSPSWMSICDHVNNDSNNSNLNLKLHKYEKFYEKLWGSS